MLKASLTTSSPGLVFDPTYPPSAWVVSAPHTVTAADAGGKLFIGAILNRNGDAVADDYPGNVHLYAVRVRYPATH